MNQTVKVLLVEDDPEDAEMTREMLKSSKLSLDISVTNDGVEALAYLRTEGAFAGAPRPDFILLDLNMPRKDGREVLQEMKGDEKLKDIPVAIFTTSSSESDVKKCLGLGADLFITKPVGLKNFEKVVRQLEEFWDSVRRRGH